MKKKGLNFSKIIYIFRKAFCVGMHSRSMSSKVVICLGFVAVFFPVISSLVLEEFTNTMHDLVSHKSHNWNYAIMQFTIICVLQIGLKIYESLQEYHVVYDTECVRAYIKEQVLKLKCQVQFKYIENSGDFTEKIAFIDTYAGERVARCIQNIAIWLQDVIQFILIICVLQRVNIWIIVALIATSIPAVALAYIQNDADYSYKVKWMKEGAFLINYFFDICSLRTLNEVRYFGLVDYIKSLWKNTFRQYVTKRNQITRKHVLLNITADILRNGVYLVILLILAHNIYNNPSIGIGVFMLALTLSKQLQQVTIRLFVGIAQFLDDIIYMKNFFELEEMEPDCSIQTNEKYKNSEICFHNVSFTYPNTSQKVLKDINLTIPSGQKVAIVGVNGSGKTTLINLLCGMYTEFEGEITIDNENIIDNISKVRNSISVIFQDYGRYETTIKDNIIMSSLETNDYKEKHLDIVTKKAGIFEKIHSLPHKYEEEVGSFSSDNRYLSGGEWQKIAISRALYRDDSSIMILDEPTASLDPIAEAELYRNFVDLTEGRTTILISHRLGVTSIVDRVIVMKEGRVVEDGSHSMLMKLNGVYAEMYRAQSKWYI